MKRIFFGLPVLLSVLFFAQGASAQTLDSEQSAFLTLINTYRAQNGAGPLQVSVALQNSSQWMSNDMATKNYFAHTDSLGRDPFTRMAAFGYNYTPAGENIAAGNSTAASTLTQWQTACDPDTSGACTYAHRQNMLNPSFKVMGIGRAYGGSSTYGWYWTTDFGGVVDTVLNSNPPSPPTVGSVSPSSGGGTSHTFTATYNDAAGVTDLNVVYLDFGTSAGSANSCFVAYVRASNALLLLSNDNSATVAGSITPGASGTLSNSQCTISGSGGSVSSGGTTLTVPINVTFTSSFTGSKNIYGLAQNNAGTQSGWTTLGTWTPSTGGTTTPLSALSVLPNSGSGAGPQTFTALYSDPNGATDINVVYLDVAASAGATNSCFVAYVRSANALYLLNNANTGTVTGSITPGGAGSLSNSQCTITGTGGAVTTSGSNLTVPFNVAFASGFTGAKNVYGLAQNNAGTQGGWQTLGSWTIGSASVALAATSVTPKTGSGFGPQIFTATFTDPNGASDLGVVYLDFATSAGSANSCFVAYVPAAKTLYLLNNANTGTVAGTVTPGGSGSVSNSQCTLTGSGGAVTSSGTTLTVPFSITFANGFTGAKNIYGLAQNASGIQGGWQTLGTWTP